MKREKVDWRERGSELDWERGGEIERERRWIGKGEREEVKYKETDKLERDRGWKRKKLNWKGREDELEIERKRIERKRRWIGKRGKVNKKEREGEIGKREEVKQI